jgi:ferredoxin--NADP+ reductase
VTPTPETAARPAAAPETAPPETATPDPASPDPAVRPTPGQPPLRLAVVGAGPAGIYAGNMALAALPEGTTVDLFDRLPVPFGLVRYGVAPDHPGIGYIVSPLQKVLEQPAMRFFGNVEYGRDLHLDDLRQRYDAVIFATGAHTDAPLDLPGWGASGTHGASEFVAWYDSHPDAPRTWPLGTREVAVIGNGNVALDITRVLAKPPLAMASTDIPAHVAAGLAASQVTDVHVFGRRGPGYAKFTPLELRELGQIPGIRIVTDADGWEIDQAAREAAAASKQRTKVLETLEEWHASPAAPAGDGSAERRVHLHFHARPSRVLTDESGSVAAFEIERTAPAPGGGIVSTGRRVTYPVQAVYAAVGYFGSPLEGLTFDARHGVLANDEGRLLDAEGVVVPGLYTTGWIKRGPVGLIGHTKADGKQTVAHVAEDAPNLARAGDRDPGSIERLLRDRGVVFTTREDWALIDAAERAAGAAEGRSRVKTPTWEAMMALAGRGPGAPAAAPQR